MTDLSPRTSDLPFVIRRLVVGKETLQLRSLLPASGVVASVAIVHGYGDHGARYADLQAALAGAGFASHALDFRGQGESTGRRSYVDQWDDYLTDLSAFLASECFPAAGGLPIFVIAHSHGGLVATVAGIRGLLPSAVRGVVMSAPYFAPAFVIPPWKRLLARVANQVHPSIRVASGLGGTPMCSDLILTAETQADPLICRTATPRWFVGATAAQRRAMADAERFRLPLKVLIGQSDSVAEPERMREFFRRAGSPDKTIREYPGLLHELLRETSRAEIFAEIIAWMRQRL